MDGIVPSKDDHVKGAWQSKVELFQMCGYCTYQWKKYHYIPFALHIWDVDVSTQLCHSLHRTSKHDA
jgi:hypothetical protein